MSYFFPHWFLSCFFLKYYLNYDCEKKLMPQTQFLRDTPPLVYLRFAISPLCFIASFFVVVVPDY